MGKVSIAVATKMNAPEVGSIALFIVSIGIAEFCVAIEKNC
jgi:hypothetical protein